MPFVDTVEKQWIPNDDGSINGIHTYKCPFCGGEVCAYRADMNYVHPKILEYTYCPYCSKNVRSF